MWLWRKVLNNSLSDKVCNEEVLRRVGEERATVSVINRRQGVWLFKGLKHSLIPSRCFSILNRFYSKRHGKYNP